MRPISIKQNTFRYPLNIILGTEAQIRLLRVMTTDVNGPISIVDAADRADLTPLGARKAMKRLVASGFIRIIGGGRGKLYEVSQSDRLVQAVAAIFSAETDRFENVLASIRKCLENVEPPPISAWMPSLPADAEKPIKICVLQDARNVKETTDNLRDLFQELEKRIDMTIELIGFTKADEPQEASESIHLYGVPLSKNGKHETGITNVLESHEQQDKKLIGVCRIIARMIMEDGSIIERAKQHIELILKGKSDSAVGDVEEWRAILRNYSLQRLGRLLESDEERATRLRQSCPFLAVLTEKEKKRVFEELEGEI